MNRARTNVLVVLVLVAAAAVAASLWPGAADPAPAAPVAMAALPGRPARIAALPSPRGPATAISVVPRATEMGASCNQRTYEFGITQDATIELDPAKFLGAQGEPPVRQNARIETSGRLVRTAWPPTGRGAALVGYEIRISAQDPATGRNSATPIEAELVVEVAPDGRFQTLRFPRGLDARTRRLAAGVVCETQFVRGSGESWTSVEECALGSVAFRYASAGPAAMVRRIENVLRLDGATDAGAEVQVERAEGLRRIELDADGGLAAVEGDEAVSLSTPDGSFRLETRQETTIRAIGIEERLPAARFQERLGAILADSEVLAVGDRALARAAHAERVHESELREIGGKSLDGVLANSDASCHETLGLAILILKHDPDAAGQARRVLGGLAADRAEILVAALGAAGTPGSQRVLAEIYGDTGHSEDSRLSALWSLEQTERPDFETAQAVADSARTPETDLFSHSALLTLGTIAGRLESARDQDRALAMLDRIGRSDTRAYLTALGNARLPQILERIRPYFGSDDASLRELAIGACEFLEDPTTLGVVERALESDSEASVRRRALDVLASRDESGSVDAIAGALVRDSSVEVRLRAAELLAERLSNAPEVRERLREATRDSSPEVREAALAALAANP